MTHMYIWKHARDMRPHAQAINKSVNIMSTNMEVSAGRSPQEWDVNIVKKKAVL
jgi:hypothetical protein